MQEPRKRDEWKTVRANGKTLTKKWVQVANVVEIHNNIVEGIYKFTREQQLMLLKVAHSLQMMDYDNTMKVVDVEYQVGEIAKFLMLDERTVRSVIKTLQKCIMTFKNLDQKWECDVNIFTKAKYHAGGKIEIRIDEDMIPFFKTISANYTKANIQEVVKLDSGYTIRIYNILRKLQYIQKPAQSVKKYEIEEFKKMLGIPQNWSYYDIKRKILEPSKQSIDENTFINMDYQTEEKREGVGRPKVTHIILGMSKKEAYQPKLF